MTSSEIYSLAADASIKRSATLIAAFYQITYSSRIRALNVSHLNIIRKTMKLSEVQCIFVWILYFYSVVCIVDGQVNGINIYKGNQYRELSVEWKGTTIK